MGSAFGVEAGAGGFEGVGEVVVGLAFVVVEEVLVCAGSERECEVAERVDGGLVGAGFASAMRARASRLIRLKTLEHGNAPVERIVAEHALDIRSSSGA